MRLPRRPTNFRRSVSIHAPARGATYYLVQLVDIIGFQFTHPRGVRRCRGCGGRDARMFQFTHPRGVRPFIMRLLLRFGLFQFTHPRGVRLPRLGAPAQSAVRFNSRTREGCDMFLAMGRNVCFTFQFTHPRGVRRYWQGAFAPFVSFNSRTREGCDFVVRNIVNLKIVSIHAPARGATCRWATRSWAKWFQFTHPRGVRRHHLGCNWLKNIGFNSRTREGCD